MSEVFAIIQFEQPQWLAFIPTIAVLLAVLLWKNPLLLKKWQQTTESGRKNTYYFPNSAILEDVKLDKKKSSKHIVFFSQYIKYLILLSLAAIALSQPYQKGQKLPNPPSYHDIVFLVDSSVTMSLMDYQLNGQRIERMAMLKNVLDHFITSLDGSRIGINVFSERVYTLAPLTTDYELLGVQLNRLESAVLTGRTSNPSQAMLYTAKQYQESAKKPALVMLTDINRPDRKIDPRTAASYLAQQGFHLHIIGIGAGSKQAENTDDVSSLIYQPANFRLLEEIASSGKGQFYWAKDITNLNTALKNIQQAEKRIVSVQSEYIKQPLYMWFVGIALAWISFWQLAPLIRVS